MSESESAGFTYVGKCSRLVVREGARFASSVRDIGARLPHLPNRSVAYGSFCALVSGPIC